MLTTSAILYVNLLIPKRQFKTMDECLAFKSIVEKRISVSYNPVDMFRRTPTLTCVLKTPVPKAPKISKKVPKPVKITKPIKVPKVVKPKPNPKHKK